MPIWSMAGLSLSLSAAVTAGCSCGAVYATTSSERPAASSHLRSARRGLGLALLGHALAHHVHHARQELRVPAIRQRRLRVPLEVLGPRLQLLAADHALFDQQRLDRRPPVPGIGRA